MFESLPRVFSRWAALSSLALVAALSSAGCSSPCLSLQQVICECEGRTQQEQGDCEQVVRTQEGLAPPDDAALERCEELIPGCREIIDREGCEILRRPEGKRACGMAEAEG